MPAAFRSGQRVLETFRSTFKRAVETVQGLWERFGDKIIGGLSFIVSIWKTQFQVITSVLDIVVGTLSDLVSFAVAVFTGDIPGALNAMKSVFSRIWGNVAEIVVAAFDAILGPAVAIATVFDSDLAVAIVNLRNRLSGMKPNLDSVGAAIVDVGEVSKTAAPDIGAATTAIGELDDEATTLSKEEGSLGRTFRKLKNIKDLEVKPHIIISETGKNKLDEIKVTTDDLRAAPDVEIDVDLGPDISETEAELDAVLLKLSGEGPGSLHHALTVDLLEASGLAFETGIPGQIGSLIDGAIASLMQALTVDLVDGLLNSGLGAAFNSIFGKDGIATKAIEATLDVLGKTIEKTIDAVGDASAGTGLLGSIASFTIGIGAALAATQALGAEWDKLPGKIARAFSAAADAGFPLGGPGPGVEGPPVPGDLGSGSSGLSQAVNAGIQEFIDTLFQPGMDQQTAASALLSFLEDFLTADQFAAFTGGFVSQQDILDYLMDRLPGSAMGGMSAMLSRALTPGAEVFVPSPAAFLPEPMPRHRPVQTSGATHTINVLMDGKIIAQRVFKKLPDVVNMRVGRG